LVSRDAPAERGPFLEHSRATPAPSEPLKVNSGMNDRVSIDPEICHGKPVINGTRVLVSSILGALAGGDTLDDMLEDYPDITSEDIAAALEFASQLSNYQLATYEIAG